MTGGTLWKITMLEGNTTATYGSYEMCIRTKTKQGAIKEFIKVAPVYVIIDFMIMIEYGFDDKPITDDYKSFTNTDEDEPKDFDEMELICQKLVLGYSKYIIEQLDRFDDPDRFECSELILGQLY
jgi:hypothetical protein